MGKIGRELVRIAEERVIMFERGLDQCHPDDHRERARITKALNEARASLADKLAMLRRDEGVY